MSTTNGFVPSARSTRKPVLSDDDGVHETATLCGLVDVAETPIGAVGGAVGGAGGGGVVGTGVGVGVGVTTCTTGLGFENNQF